MKKNLYILPLLGALLLTGCNNTPAQQEKITLTYGTYATNDITKVKYGDLLGMMDDKESFIIATYESDTTGCSCWRNLEFNMKKLINEYHYNFYKIEYMAFGEQDTMGLTVLRDRPALHFVRDGKVDETFVYSTSNPNPIFKDKNALLNKINELTNKPNYYFMPALKTNEIKESIDTHIDNDETFIACYYSDSCGDCKYVFPKLMYPFTKNKEFKMPMYLINLDVEGVALTNGQPDKENPRYQEFKDNHRLSAKGDSVYGYNNGYVPTFHYYENGELKDAAVYFNDKVEKIDNKFIIKDTFYTTKRQASLHYLDNVEIPVLENIELNEADVIEYNNNYYFAQESAARYHNPLLEAFLTRYAI